MPKPACMKCNRFFRIKRNGVHVLEGKPIGRDVRQGQPHGWEPYKLWRADLWQCDGCGATITTGYGTNPVMENHIHDPTEMNTAAEHRIYDC